MKGTKGLFGAHASAGNTDEAMRDKIMEKSSRESRFVYQSPRRIAMKLGSNVSNRYPRTQGEEEREKGSPRA